MLSSGSDIAARISEATGESFEIKQSTALQGGCISNASYISNGVRSYFLKTNTVSFLDQFKQEKQALEEIVETNTLRAPRPICFGRAKREAFLVLEYIETGRPREGSWESMGRLLATLHKERKPYFGWEIDNTIGSTYQPNQRRENWPIFFREQRLEYQLKLCRSKGLAIPGSDELLDSIETFLEGYSPSPSLLHGDLWSGNAAFDKSGEPFVFDPCSYYGDRETDLAFTEFFGGFDSRFYQAYNETMPINSGYGLRKDLYNLYHCLNHFYIFGGGYGRQAQSMVNQLLSEIR